MSDNEVGICYRKPHKEEEVRLSLLQTTGEKNSKLQVTICSKGSRAGYKQYKRFLECFAENFLMQMISESGMRHYTLLQLLVANHEELLKM